MKLNNGLKRAMIKRLGLELSNKITLEEYNNAFLLLDKWNTTFKIIPYGLFEMEGNPYLTMTKESSIFLNWVHKNTKNIEKDFNKGRKLVRLTSDIIKKNEGVLVFNLSANNIFPTVINALFLEYNEQKIPFKHVVSDKERYLEVLKAVREYVAAVFLIELLEDIKDIEEVFDLFITNTSEDVTLDFLDFGYTHFKQVVLQ